jgi:hypothetical protein
VNALELIQAVETSGGTLAVNGDKLRCSIPREASHLIDALRAHKPEVITILQKRELSGLPWPNYNGGKQFCCQHCGAHFDTSVGFAKHQVSGCVPETGDGSIAQEVARILPFCPVCGSYAVYREKDGRQSCQTCNAS